MENLKKIDLANDIEVVDILKNATETFFPFYHIDNRHNLMIPDVIHLLSHCANNSATKLSDVNESEKLKAAEEEGLYDYTRWIMETEEGDFLELVSEEFVRFWDLIESGLKIKRIYVLFHFEFTHPEIHRYVFFDVSNLDEKIRCLRKEERLWKRRRKEGDKRRGLEALRAILDYLLRGFTPEEISAIYLITSSREVMRQIAEKILDIKGQVKSREIERIKKDLRALAKKMLLQPHSNTKERDISEFYLGCMLDVFVEYTTPEKESEIAIDEATIRKWEFSFDSRIGRKNFRRSMSKKDMRKLAKKYREAFEFPCHEVCRGYCEMCNNRSSITLLFTGGVKEVKE